jgi:polyhydroxyalkanoate synthase
MSRTQPIIPKAKASAKAQSNATPADTRHRAVTTTAKAKAPKRVVPAAVKKTARASPRVARPAAETSGDGPRIAALDGAGSPRRKPAPTEDIPTQAGESQGHDAPAASAINDTMSGFARAYQHWLQAAATQPERMQAWQATQVAQQGELMQNYLRSLVELASPQETATRWQAYLVAAHKAAGSGLLEAVESIDLDNDEKRRMRFFMKQYVDATAPQNQLFGNSEALQLAQESQGESLRAGLQNLMDDVKRGRISMTDDAAFAIGKNLAMTPGAVVFENPIFQLLQYQPCTKQVHERPLLIVPPCINKFYILDLQPENSFVRYAVEQGYTVFLVSWKNVKEDGANLTWHDYVDSGVVRAITAAREIAGANKINALGFCVGGTLLGTALAALAARKQHWVASATFLTTLLDFSDVGDIRAYIDQPFVKAREAALASGGLVAGAELAQAFASLRANDLIWSFVINNYLKGKKPSAFDLLYWNADSTNLPGPMYAYYLRNMYLDNKLARAGTLDVNGTPIDLSRINIPAFVFAAREDHIVPWRTAALSGKLLGGEVQFVLGASGHIAGVVNPPSKNKRSFWAGGKGKTPDVWLSTAQETPGSWWPTWSSWLAKSSGKKVAAPKQLGGKGYKVIEAAPGRYVKEGCE